MSPEALPTTVSLSMQSRVTRFVLRIETGDRKGEQVPLVEGTVSVGRRPDSGLSLADGSVSGKHAELRVAGARLEVVDLGSTNGTRVGGAKIESALLSHGDALQFGNVRLTVHDVEFAGGDGPALEEPVLEGGPPAAASGDGGKMLSVTSDMVARSKKGSKLLPIVAGVLVLGAGGAYAYVKFLRPSGGGAALVTVPSVPGNLLADASFEDGGAEWISADAAPAAFLRERAGARSGVMGLASTLEAGGWALARSGEFPLAARRALAFGAALAAEDGARARLGVELTSSSGALPAHTAWLPAGTGGDSRTEFDVPGGYDRGRLVVAALGPGRVTLDDVVALEAEARGGAAKFNEYELCVLGAPGASAVLLRSGETLIAGFDLSRWTRANLAGWAEAELAAGATPNGLRLSFPGAPATAELAFEVSRAAAQGSGWLATLGPDGYASHGADFERANVASVLLGSDLELVRLSFAEPVTVRSASAEGTVTFRVALGGLEACDLQLSFAQERAEAATLARRGGEAEKQGDRGAALSIWSGLLDRFPFEKSLVTQASAARARLVASGMAEVDQIQSELERARFFLLPELFHKTRTHALELARAYAGSDVEGEARRAADESFMALSELTAGKAGGAAELLAGVLEALDPGAAPRLRAHVEQALKARAEAREE